jgi:hypothetical protein
MVLLTMGMALPALAADTTDTTLQITPAEIRLDGASDRQRLVVSETADGRMVDLTRLVSFRSSCPELVEVDPLGVVRPLANGEAEVIASVDGREVHTRVLVSGLEDLRPVTVDRVTRNSRPTPAPRPSG